LNPSEEIAPAWQGWFVKTSDGRTHQGRQIDVGNESVELMMLDGSFETYRDVEAYGPAEVSLMPAGLEHQLRQSDLQHLISFLEESEGK
jgi:putative heme-binding domain-containing protein